MFSIIKFIQAKWRFSLVLFAGLMGLLSLGIKGYLNTQSSILKAKSKNVIHRVVTHNAPRGSILDHQGRVLAVDVSFYEYDFDMDLLHQKWLATYTRNMSEEELKSNPFDFTHYLDKAEIQLAITKIAKIFSISEKEFNKVLQANGGSKKQWVIQKKITLQEHENFQRLKRNFLQQQKAIVKKYKKGYHTEFKKLVSQEKSDEILNEYRNNGRVAFFKLETTQQVVRSFFDAISFYEYYQRTYPYQNVLSQLLGHMRIDKNREAFDGVEKRLDKQLRGSSGRIEYLKNMYGKRVEIVDNANTHPTKSGKDVRLTIDYRLQYILNRELYKQLHRHRAESASALLVEVESGAIRAVASQPNYNPNNNYERTSYRTRLRSLLDYVEPGSVQKPLLIAAGLESGELMEDSTVSVSRSNYFTWRNSPLVERRYTKPTTIGIEEVIKYSINSGIVKFAEKVNKESLWMLYDKLGYGAEYDIFEGRRGISNLAHSDSWNDSDYFTRTYGYSEKLTIFNILAFYLAVANKGILPPIHLLPKKQDEIRRHSVRVLNTHTADIMTEILSQVTKGYGTGRLARVKGIDVSGKTGTSRKGGVSILKYRATFIGFAPRNNPKYVLAVMVDEPSQNEELYSGGSVAAPLFASIMEQALKEM